MHFSVVSLSTNNDGHFGATCCYLRHFKSREIEIFFARQIVKIQLTWVVITVWDGYVVFAQIVGWEPRLGVF